MNNKNIKYKWGYFRKVIKNMNLKDEIKQSEIEAMEKISFEDYLLAQDKEQKHGRYLYNSIDEADLSDWLDCIDNPILYKAIKSLSKEEQKLIEYIAIEELTQKEIAKIYNVDRITIWRKVNRIKSMLGEFLGKK